MSHANLWELGISLICEFSSQKARSGLFCTYGISLGRLITVSSSLNLCCKIQQELIKDDIKLKMFAQIDQC